MKEKSEFSYLRLNFVTTHPKHRHYVKKLALCAISEDEFTSRRDFHFHAPYNLLESSFPSAFLFFENLPLASLLKVMVDDAIVKSLSELPSLKHASFSCPNFAWDKISPVIDLESLSITYSMDPEEYALEKMFSNRRLKKHIVWMSRLSSTSFGKISITL